MADHDADNFGLSVYEDGNILLVGRMDPIDAGYGSLCLPADSAPHRETSGEDESKIGWELKDGGSSRV